MEGHPSDAEEEERKGVDATPDAKEQEKKEVGAFLGGGQSQGLGPCGIASSEPFYLGGAHAQLGSS